MNRAGKKTLVACYSRSGNTRMIANLIHAQVGGDIFAIEMSDPYSKEDQECHVRAEGDMKNKTWPRLATKIENPDSYNVIFVGYPIWWGTMSPPLFTFFGEYDFSGKIIIPFCTFGGSGPGQSVEDISVLTPNSEVFGVLGVKTSEVKNAQEKVSEWLKQTGRIE